MILRSAPDDRDGRPALVVSIHDVSPFTWGATQRILDELAPLGVGRTSLLVVPDHHHRGHFLSHPDFCDWLKNVSEHGHEPVIHGYFHQRARRAGESPLAKLTTRIYTADEGEFYDLAGDEARRLVNQAKAEFAELDLRPAGFIAPAWLLSAGGENALRELGLRYTTRLQTVSIFPSSAMHRSQSLVWSVRSGWRRAMSLVWNGLLFRRLRANPLLRVSIHPPDFAHPVIRRQILALVAAALEEREAVTYGDWVSRHPGVSAAGAMRD